MTIQIDDLSYAYSATHDKTLRGLNLVVDDHQFVLILGASGCGKSTLSLCLNGLIPQVAGGSKTGRVLVNQLDTDQHPVARLATQVGLVFQDPEAQLSSLIVRDEIVFGPESLNVPRAEILRRLDKYLRLVGMQQYAEAYTYALSGGQKQRVALASVLAMEPSILVLDEPTSNLDPIGAQEFMTVLEGLADDRAMTIVAIEHQVDRLCQRADWVVIIDEGQIVAQGPPRVVFQDHQLFQHLGVWTPQVTRLAVAVSKTHGLDLGDVPLTLAEAQAWLEERHIRLDLQPYTQTLQPNTGQPHLQVRGLRHSYAPGQESLRGIDLDIQRGDFIALLGPNGSGKTTLTKHFVGLLRPQSGQVTLDGRSLATQPIYEITAHVGYVFQYPDHQFITEKVWDEVAYSLRVRQLPETDIKQRVDAALALFNLAHLSERHPLALSMGQKRRLSVATMMVVEPDVLILDEPTMGLDLVQTEALLGYLERLNAQGRTIIIVTHDMQVVARWSRRVIAMLDGQVAFQGTPRELFGQADLLAAAGMQAPPVVQLVRQLHPEVAWQSMPLTIEEFVSASRLEVMPARQPKRSYAVHRPD